MSQDAYLHPKCWCGGDQSVEFSPEYRQCASCKTLFLATPLPQAHFEVAKGETGFYGEKYWTHHVVAAGLPHIQTRTRTDLPERNLHWLRALLRYRLPEKKVLEVACAHGSFVALLRRAGFDASGLEVSPAILDFARRTFQIPTVLGPVEDAGLPSGQLDAIAAMDVLEHFPHPLDSMRRLADLLNDDGLFLIQTPCLHRPESSHQDLKARDDRFLVHLKKDEHIYLFNRESARLLFEELGFSHVEFLEPIFDYDMFVVASRRPLTVHSDEEIADALTSSVDGRMTLALLDLDDRRRALYESWQEAERDRAARLEVIGALDAKISLMRSDLEFCERDRAERLEVIKDLGGRLSKAEGDAGEARAELASFRRALEASEADRAARLQVIEDLGARLSKAESDVGEAQTQLSSFRQALDASEADRAARLQVIEDLGARLSKAESARLEAKAELASLQQAFQSSEADRAARLTVIEQQGARIAAFEARVHSLTLENSDLLRRLEAVRQKFSGSLIGKTLTAAGWFTLPPPGDPAANDPS